MKDYPAWVCLKCGEKAAKRKPGLATWHTDKCDVCGETDSVTEPRDFGYPAFPPPDRREA